MFNLRSLIAILLLTLSSFSSAKQELLWVKWNLMPEYIDSGEHQGKGYLDQFLNFVQAQLPEYEHREEFQTPNRISRSWAKGNVCTVHLWLGYWPKQIVYSRSYAFTPRFGVVTKRGSPFHKRYSELEELSLKSLLESGEYTLGMLPLYYAGSSDARYPLMANILAPYLGTPLVQEFRNNRNEMSVAYLDKGRADFIIRQRITHYAELKIKNKLDNYSFHFLQEGKRHKLTASACSNSELGKEVIDKINGMMNDAFHRKYLEYRQEWDKDNHHFNQTFLDYFINRVNVEYVTE